MSTLKGELVYPVLNQDVTWTADGHNLPVDSMERSHKVNVVRWLEVQANHLAMAYLRSHFLHVEALIIAWNPSENIEDHLRREVDELMDRVFVDPIAWLHSTTFVTRLDRDIANTPDPTDTRDPWADQQAAGR